MAYSLLDTRQLAENYLALATLTYASRHYNLSLMYKHFVPKLGVLLGDTYRYASSCTHYQCMRGSRVSERLAQVIQ